MTRPVRILSTGGTFGMEIPPAGGTRALDVPDLDAAGLKARLLQRAPDLKRLADCRVEVLFNLDSAHLGPAHWLEIAAAVRRAHRRGEGVVILHGTDTAAYTASALSFLLGACRLPVVLTGAQRPLAAIRNDALGNLLTAVELAASSDLPSAMKQVTLVFGDVLLQGNRARKRSAAEFDAFESPQATPLAMVGTQVRFLGQSPREKFSSTRPKVERFDSRVAMFHLTPGFPAEMVRERLLPELRALVLVAFASGTAPTQDPEFMRLLRDARLQGKPVIVTTEGATRAPQEAAEGLAAYAAGEKMLEAGVLWAGEMTPECAWVKASLGVAQMLDSDWKRNPSRSHERFKKFWLTSFAAEGVPAKPGRRPRSSRRQGS